MTEASPFWHASCFISRSEMSAEDGARVLVAEDDGAMRDMLAACLEAEGISVEQVSDGRQLRERLGADDGTGPDDGLPSVLVSDVRMPGWTGLRALHYLSEHHPQVRVVLITAFGDPQTHERAERLGAAAIFDKPFDLSALRRTVLSLVEG